VGSGATESRLKEDENQNQNRSPSSKDNHLKGGGFRPGNGN
jgi:hypothetical protein